MKKASKSAKGKKKRKSKRKVLERNRQKHCQGKARKRQARYKQLCQEASEKEILVLQIRSAIKHYFADLTERLNNLEDPRLRRQYELGELLMGGIMLFIFKEGSRNAYNNDRAEQKFAKNYYRLFQLRLPHMDTADAVLRLLKPEELEEVKCWMIRTLLEKRVLHKFRLFKKYFTISIDGTGYATFDYEPYGGCPFRTYKNDRKVWCQPVLEAKLVGHNGFCLSIETEWIMNVGEWDKQDCELKAFKRLAARLKQKFPRLPICILADGLYPNKSIFDICQDNGWSFILTLKDDQLKDIWDEVAVFDQLYAGNKERKEIILNAEKQVVFTYKWINGIAYQGHALNWIEGERAERNIKTGEEKRNRFVQVTSFEGSSLNCADIIRHGRLRWKVENEGFNTQKNQGYELQHKFSRRNPTAIKNYFQCMQIAHIINQLVELSEAAKQLLKAKVTLKHLWKVMIAFMYFAEVTEEQLQFQRTQFRFP